MGKQGQAPDGPVLVLEVRESEDPVNRGPSRWVLWRAGRHGLCVEDVLGYDCTGFEGEVAVRNDQGLRRIEVARERVGDSNVAVSGLSALQGRGLHHDPLAGGQLFAGLSRWRRSG